MTLTNEWQQFGSGYLTKNIYIALDGKVVSQNTQTNSSVVQLRFRSVNSRWRTTNGTARFIGLFTDSGSCATYPNYISDGDTIFQIEKTIYHDSDGNKTFNIGGVLTAYVPNKIIVNIPLTGLVLPRIDRNALITNCNDFNDEQNPKMTFTNPGNFRINARLEFNSQSITRENISNTGSYTFELTSEERNLLRQNCTGKTMTIKYVLATCYTGTTESYTSEVNKTMSIVNANPTFSVAYQDTNSTTLAITNNNQQLIQNVSTAQFNITNATAYKGASVSQVKITINGVEQIETINNSSMDFNYGTINSAVDLNAEVVLIDSRGFETLANVPLTMLAWQNPNAIITCQRKANYYTETDIKVDASYSSLDSKNTISIKYRIKKTSDSTWGSWNTLSDNVLATFNADNTYDWNIQVELQDVLGTTTYNLTLAIGTPIFFIDKVLKSVGINCLPQNPSSLEILGELYLNGAKILESGNGFIKFTDGTLICFANTETKNCPTGGTDFDVTLPQNYINQDFAIFATKRNGGPYWANAIEHAFPLSTNSIRIGAWNDKPNTAESISYNLLTIGKWK